MGTEEGIETAVIWVISKLKSVSANIPKEMNAEHAQRKLIKIIIGVIFHVMEEMDDTVTPEERAQRLDEAIRLGYSYGLTYPFIDDLLDSGVLNTQEKQQYSQLNMICFYKTGIAFEASLVMPAILAQVKDEEITALKKFAYHAGIAFQIKNDLLDIEDVENNTSTFVSILGQEGARKEMWEHYCLAMEALKGMSRIPAFLKHLLHYIIGRDR